jgi:GR25 family glycosyltransferase involved in LPS biosynthesis
METDTFIINLERRNDRRSYMKSQMSNAGIDNFRIFDAFDNSALKLLDSREQTGRLGHAFVGVYLSHLAVLKMALALNYKEVIVLEDDVVIGPDFKEAVNNIKKELPENWDMLYLHHGASNKEHKDSYKNRVTERIYRAGYIGSFAGYMMRERGIAKLLTILNQVINEHADVAVANYNHENDDLNAYCVCPSIVEINLAMGSDNF